MPRDAGSLLGGADDSGSDSESFSHLEDSEPDSAVFEERKKSKKRKGRKKKKGTEHGTQEPSSEVQAVGAKRFRKEVPVNQMG